MSLKIIIGRAGSGKSYNLYKDLIKESRELEKNKFVAIVPEQYSMETQKEILNLHPKMGSFNIEVTSFTRLACSVLEEQGITDYKVMDDLGKTLIMRKVLEECKKDLKVYKKKATMPGFAEKMKTVISELKQYNISDEILQDMIKKAEVNRPALKHKLNDVSIISNTFNNYINQKMITIEDILGFFIKYIPSSNIIKNTYLYIDGFTGFTPIQYQVLEQLIKYSPKVTLAVTLPEDEKITSNYNKFELFSLSKETIIKTKELAIKNNVNIEENFIAGKGERPYRIKDNKELCFLEENIFRNKSLQYNEQKCSGIEIHKISNAHKEAQYVADEISKLVVSKGYRYNEIAVITGDMNGYYRYLEEEFMHYNIPAFIDHTRNISANPFIDGIIGAIEVIYKDFSYESVFHFLRLSISNMALGQVDIFENYVLQSGRRGYLSYNRQWEKCYKGMEEDSLSTVNQVREFIINIFKPLREALKKKGATVLDYTKAMYNFILSLDFQKKISSLGEDFEKENQHALAGEYSQIYEAIISLMDKLVTLMGEEKMTLKEYKEILATGFETIKLGIIPPAIDVVMVGDVERTRLKDTKKIIFFIGVNDGIIPKSGVSGGVITDADREFLDNKEFILAPTARADVFKQRVYLYSLMAKPSEKIIMTYSKLGTDGSVKSKSYLINTIMKLFPAITEIDEDAVDISIDSITTKKAALRYVASNMRSYQFNDTENLFRDIAAILMGDEQSKGFIKTITLGAFYKRKNEKLDKIIARRLYGIKDNIGTTRLERYAKCAYSQFLANGLKLGERKKHKIAAVDVGNLYHDAINIFFEEVEKEGIKWGNIDKKTGMEIIDYCVEKVVDEYDNDAMESTARNLFIKKQVRETAEKTVDVLIKHITSGEFSPGEYELRVTHGRIDRVDIMKNENDIYVKVIDYKSGNKRFDITETYFGLQMQLMIYLKDAMAYEQNKYPEAKVYPAGGLYFHIKNPYIEKPDFTNAISKFKEDNPNTELSNDEIKQEIISNIQYREYRMSGLVNSQEEVIKAFDTPAFINGESSKIVPVEKTKTGYGSRSMILKTQEYNSLIDHVAKLSDTMGEEIMEGNIDVNPVKGACTYCPYNRVCFFDEKLGDEYRSLEKISLNNLSDKLSQKQDD